MHKRIEDKKCNCEAKYIVNRYINRGGVDEYITIYDRKEKDEFKIEQIGVDAFSDNGYDEVYYCQKCHKVGYINEFSNIF